MGTKNRNVMICAVDTDQGSDACSWFVDQVYREGDVVHLVYVARTLKPPMEVFHGLPGTAYSFKQPGSHHEMETIEHTRAVIEARYVPILKRKNVKYHMHMYAVNVDASNANIAEIIQKAATEEIKPDLLLLTTHNRPVDTQRDHDCVGGVTSSLIKNCRLPLVIIPPTDAIC
ncbi:hypothetical protein H632_c959p1 [Helicosporidium sp. ATCC 50920]|nr:hypothetical protein H632_c959p1 [Helicosporidium sp. ATCC 50920]|eukprot:KDD74965.1 hypothetical protein H632_c959p1 [Helicosporidium sp. ATCC 50920]